jgi:prepilin-type N-terminal cleavage/methylation domain-containing protein
MRPLHLPRPGIVHSGHPSEIIATHLRHARSGIRKVPPTSRNPACRRLFPPSPSTLPGFSLIEVIGVLAVLSILLATLAPMMIAGYDRAARDREQRELESIGRAIHQHILRNSQIPDAAGFPTAVANQLGWTTTSVTNNPRGLRRAYVLDPRLTNHFPIPFNQSPLGLTNLPNVELGILILGTIGEPLPNGVVSGFASSQIAYSNLWNLAEGSLPADWTWAGRPEDLRIARVNVGTLFVPLVLNYGTYINPGSGNQGRFTIGNSTTNILPTSPSYTAHFLRGSVLGLHHHAGTVNTLQVSEVLQHPMSFVYEGDAWRGQLFLGRGMRLTSGLDVQAAHDLFMPAPHNLNAQGGATTTNIILALSNYMKAYITWQGPPINNAAYNSVKTYQGQLETLTSDMLHKPTGGGGTK